MKTLSKFAKNEFGATAIEYGLIAALIGVAIIAVLQSTSTEIQATFNDVATGLKARTGKYPALASASPGLNEPPGTQRCRAVFLLAGHSKKSHKNDHSFHSNHFS